MISVKKNIISDLQKEILSLQGFMPVNKGEKNDLGLGSIAYAFANQIFPLRAVHEFLHESVEQMAASTGFISFLLSSLMKNGAAAIWIGPGPVVFPPALTTYGVPADNIIFIHAQNKKEILWIMEEALKCEGLAAVIAETKDIGFTESRRLQLAVEKSHVTGFILLDQPRRLPINNCVARWKISPVGSRLEQEMPGIGFATWHIELLKIRNGKPGTWKATVINRKLFIEEPIEALVEIENRKIV